MLEVLLFVVVAILVAIFWRLFAGLAVFVAIVVAGALMISEASRDKRERAAARQLQQQEQVQQRPAQQQPRRVSVEPIVEARFVLVRDDRRMADGKLVEVGRFPTKAGCEIAGNALSASADRVEIHFCVGP
jgi:cation transport ATPase